MCICVVCVWCGKVRCVVCALYMYGVCTWSACVCVFYMFEISVCPVYCVCVCVWYDVCCVCCSVCVCVSALCLYVMVWSNMVGCGGYAVHV